MAELKTVRKTEVENFEIKFDTSRETIDEIRHRMHIEKMNLAAMARDNNATPHYEIKVPENYKTIRDDFFKFRVLFNDLKSEFLRFEGK